MNKYVCNISQMSTFEDGHVTVDARDRDGETKRLTCTVDDKENKWDILYNLLMRDFEAAIYQDKYGRYHIVLC